MALEQLGGGSGGFTYTQNSAPSSPSIGETWFDTSTDGGAGKIYADLGSGAQWHVLPVQDELQSGRTRELLLLLQDSPISEVQDPLNIQSGLSEAYGTNNDGDYIIDGQDFQSNVSNGDFTRVNNLELTPVDSITPGVLINDGRFDQNGEGTITITNLTTSTVWGSDSASGIWNDTYLEVTRDVSGLSGTHKIEWDYDYTTETLNDYIYADASPSTEVTDKFSAPTTAPTDFKAWNAISAEVNTGGSTRENPHEFELLDSTDTVLTSTRIPDSNFIDPAFKLRDRKYQTTAGSDGQSQFNIAETGDGGHYGIPIFPQLAWVKHNGSFLDTNKYTFYSDTATVEIDTSNITIVSGDSITISYDFDLFDTTLKPRVWLFRNGTSEESPSISHFRYEYIV
jgi:hypothetical protein